MIPPEDDHALQIILWGAVFSTGLVLIEFTQLELIAERHVEQTDIPLSGQLWPTNIDREDFGSI